MAQATVTPTRSPEAFVTEAEALFKEGKLSQAIDAYTAAINAAPQNPEYYTALARVQVWAGTYEAAQKNAENALLLNPNSAMAHAVHAWALNFQAGRNGEALTAIEEALALDPNNAVIQSYYVEILTDSGFDNLERAAEQSRAGIRRGDPDQPEPGAVVPGAGESLPLPFFARRSGAGVYHCQYTEPGRSAARLFDLAHLCHLW
jgi:tetratricopeptide (TPR) repeat protein